MQGKNKDELGGFWIRLTKAVCAVVWPGKIQFFDDAVVHCQCSTARDAASVRPLHASVSHRYVNERDDAAEAADSNCAAAASIRSMAVSNVEVAHRLWKPGRRIYSTHNKPAIT